MLNLAGSSYDFDHVLFAVLQECEHRRGGLLANDAEHGLYTAALDKLKQIHESYLERGGQPDYWREVENEVLKTALPQYVPQAIEQTRLERTNYDLWRRGDPLARACWGLGALAVGGLIVALPFIPIFEDAFALALGAAGLFYPEIKRGFFNFRHARTLNRLIAGAQAYQKNRLIHYMTDTELFEAIDVAEKTAQTASAAAADPAKPAPDAQKAAGRQAQRT